MIETKSIEDLKQKADIVAVVEHYIEVKKSGANFISLCPFHDDKNPSMSINPQKGFFHCFACKAGGDVFRFVQDYERVSFQEAVEKVAQICNFSLNYSSQKQESNKALYEILPLLNAFYKQNLSQHKEAINYLYSRALSDEDIRKFELGFAPSSEESLRLLKNEKIELKNALECGAVKFSTEQNEYYASFIKRISFPIYDYKGLLVGFGGRTLNSEQKAKYVNSPQCRLFDKSRIFYAFHLAKDAIAKQKEMIVCEGYMDAIAFHKAGLNNAVAVLGTALTTQHLPLIKRYDARVILCFDSDSAGFNAAMRSAHLLSINKIGGKVVILEGGKDAAELVANHQSQQLFQALEKGVELSEFYIRGIIGGFDLQTPLQKQLALEAVQKYTFALEPLIANAYTDLIANLLGVKRELITLSSKKKLQVQSQINTQNSSNLAEFEVMRFLLDNKPYQKIFNELSDERCFKENEGLGKILQGANIEDAFVHELLQNKSQVQSEEDFLHSLCKINLAFLTHLKKPNTISSLKKQIFVLLDKNAIKLKRELQEAEFKEFFIQTLRQLKQSQDEEFLMTMLSNFQKNNFINSPEVF